MWFSNKNKKKVTPIVEVAPPTVLADTANDPLFDEAVKVVSQYDKASASLLQRRLSIGYSRAARIIDELEAARVVSQAEGSSPRDVLINKGSVSQEQTSTAEANKNASLEEPEEKTWVFPPLSLLNKSNSDSELSIRDVLKSDELKEAEPKISLPLGRDMLGKIITSDLSSLLHCAIVGSVGAGKSTFLKSLITSLLFRNSPAEVKLLLIDLKGFDLPIFNEVPHLLTPVITEPEKTLSAIKWVSAEMNRRFTKFAERGVRDIESYNDAEGFQALPYMIVIIDDMNNLLESYSYLEIEGAIKLLTDRGHKAGINIIVTTNAAKRNTISMFPTRIAFSTTAEQSHLFLNRSGAEKLIPGDMLYLRAKTAMPTCLQGIVTSSSEITRVKEFIAGNHDISTQSNNQNKNDAIEWEQEYEEFIKTNQDIITRFCEITARKVSIIDEYGEESWKVFIPEKQRCFTKIASKLGISERYMESLFLETEHYEVSGLGINSIASQLGQSLRYSLTQAGETNIYYSYFLVRLYFFDLEKIFREYYADHKTIPTEAINYNDLSGINFETLVGQQLAAQGYTIAGTPITGDQGADIIATKDGKRYIIQAKRYSGTVGNKAVQEVVAAKSFYSGDFAVVVTNSKFTPSAKALAQKNKVILIDGESLKEIDQLLSA